LLSLLLYFLYLVDGFGRGLRSGRLFSLRCFLLNFLGLDLELLDSFVHFSDLDSDSSFLLLTGSHLSGFSLNDTLSGLNRGFN